MAASALIDTGAILALLDPDDPWHGSCETAFRQLRFPLLTSEAVLTETFHLIDRSRKSKETAWKLLRSGAIVLGTVEDAELSQLKRLMEQYWDQPMDFADATLVHLADRESLRAILTIDQTHFAAYRLQGKRRFHILPVERP